VSLLSGALSGAILPVMYAIGRAARAVPAERYASLAVAAAGAWWLVERMAFE
jgi:hypothetical protein